MSKLIIAEKPDLARAIAKAIPGDEKAGGGYFTKGEYTITWSYGHLLEWKQPQDYDPSLKTWSMETLPIYFNNWQKTIKPSGENQANLIGTLLKQHDTVVHAGDPDDEGQYLIDELLDYFQYKGTVLRLLVSDLNTNEIKKAISNIKSNDQFVSLGKAAEARSLADLVFGINLTRLYSCANNTKLTIGRVQTPTLGLIVKRDEMVENFAEVYYYEVLAHSKNHNLKLKAVLDKEDARLTDGKILNKGVAEELANNLVDENIKLQVKSKPKKLNPPLPFNLTKLQSKVSKVYGYSPQETLDITQALREKYKAITYNRSDCQYLTESHFKEANTVLPNVLKNLGVDVTPDYFIHSQCFDDKKVSAHTAIIPTSAFVDVNRLTEQERNVYELICDFYIIQFLPPNEYVEKQAVCKVQDVELRHSIKITTSQGFLKYLGSELNDKTDDPLYGLEDGEYPDIVDKTKVLNKQTAPPKRYTMDTLLSDMTCLSKYVQTPEIRDILKAKDSDKAGENGGIGTPATRASIIEKLLEQERGYVELKGKQLISTDKGRNFFNLLPNDIKTPDITAKWWLVQEKIKENNANSQELVDSVLDTIRQTIDSDQVKQMVSKNYIATCPICGAGVVEKNNVYACVKNTRTEDSCQFVIFKENKYWQAIGKKLTLEIVKALCDKGFVFVGGLQSKKTGKNYSAIIDLVLPTQDNKWVNFNMRFN